MNNKYFGPKPGFSPLYNDYSGEAPPFPANVTEPIPATATGSPMPDDVLWQNLLAAEWVIHSFYQAGVMAFNTSSFTAIGLPNNTYQRITEIRDNEAGHLRIFQDEISPTSVKPGPCQYDFPFDNDPTTFLALSTLIEIASMAFLTGLVQDAKANAVKGALTAVSQTETRHEVWSLLEVWGADPFGGPSDTVFPYPNEILDVTNRFVVPGSCPSANPPYPYPSQHLPRISVAAGTESVAVGSTVQLNFTESDNQPQFEKDAQYYAVFYHGVNVISTPITTARWPEQPITVTIPAQFEVKGVVVMVLANTTGAPTLDTVVAGPALFLQQPAELGVLVV
ncbi:hypothetical protein F5Y19DRAFT_468610 [Xylariaceae sp. FL1651]|nr:hypothetical protein F5Y19DRAFT_468610 [Xylariaceae sp. FL1651]